MTGSATKDGPSSHGALVDLAMRGDNEAQFQLYLRYRDGKRCVRSERLAAYWLQNAAQQGHARAQSHLAGCYAAGRLGLDQSWAKHRMWAQAAASQNHPRAFAQLGWIYMKGFGVTQNYPKAVTFFRRAHELGDSFGAINLGWFVERGIVVEKDLPRARALYEESAARGNVHARFNLGTMYERGVGVEVDKEKALKLYSEAAAEGNEDARAALKRLEDNKNS